MRYRKHKHCIATYMVFLTLILLASGLTACGAGGGGGKTESNTANSKISLPKTGQAKCYDDSGNVIACAGTGQDGELQKGVAWPDPRFTDNGNSTVTDNLTGLVWTKDGKAPGPAACSPGVNREWQAALDYVACLNTNSYLGYTDWRLPNINELKSLTHAGQSDTAAWLNTQGFNNVQSPYYWSSTTYANAPDYAWVVSMWSGYVFNFNKSDTILLRVAGAFRTVDYLII